MDLATISKKKVDELKDFLRLRGLKISGKKEELAARVFYAMENDLPIVKTAEEVQADIARDYERKLCVSGSHVIPDPLKLDQGWVNEKEGVRYWPVTLYMDIFNFLAFHPNEPASNDLSDYKQSKAYSYFSQGWLGQLQFNNISGDSKLCLLRGSCRPSQRINDIPHRLWICLEKQTGKIVCTHCTCMAGMSQTCNHIAAALFRIESASRLGLNNPSCTSAPCEWLPNCKAVEPTKIKELKLKRDSIGKRGRPLQEPNSIQKRNFNPIAECTYKLDLHTVATALKTICKESESILFTALPKPALPMDTEHSDTSTNIYCLSKILEDSISKEEYLDKIFERFTEQSIAEMEQVTRGQSNNSMWYLSRKHAITASIAHAVNTRFLSLQKSAALIDLTNIFKKIANEESINPDLPALKYGRNMEADAVNAFEETFKKRHQNVNVQQCGLFLARDQPFIGGSPDRIIECSCCGKSCLEVKCPFSIRHTTPTDPDIKLQFLKIGNGNLSLNQNHKYFTQCQVQMASTNLSTCYFFVWTTHGQFLEKLKFDREHWLKLQRNLEDFYISHYVPSLFS